jgi:hypothetical protein
MICPASNYIKEEEGNSIEHDTAMMVLPILRTWLAVSK